ncbi:signal peptidase I [Caproiciproducens sp. AGMB10547]|uniref:Signal peptidase I n=2 Tax=Caproiciproducens faecalis TaxID=2820301 RepID=A0ABS7DRU5_9FIRM|nr:signal peptidase I [Caproiciproducens faecalis]
MEALIPALLVILAVFVFFFRIITVNGSSMQPNFMDSYKVLMSCTDRKFSLGDVVVVDARGTSLHELIIKRVIATEGQTVDIDFHTGTVSVNGVALDESAYIKNGITKNQYDLSFPQTVPKGRVFLLGDNRKFSDDSRSSDVGMVDKRYIIGKVKTILIPYEKFGTL